MMATTSRSSRSCWASRTATTGDPCSASVRRSTWRWTSRRRRTWTWPTWSTADSSASTTTTAPRSTGCWPSPSTTTTSSGCCPPSRAAASRPSSTSRSPSTPTSNTLGLAWNRVWPMTSPFVWSPRWEEASTEIPTQLEETVGDRSFFLGKDNGTPPSNSSLTIHVAVKPSPPPQGPFFSLFRFDNLIRPWSTPCGIRVLRSRDSRLQSNLLHGRSRCSGRESLHYFDDKDIESIQVSIEILCSTSALWRQTCPSRPN